MKLILAAALALAACATQVAETPAQRVYAINLDYATALEAAAAYEAQPRCSAVVPPPCSDVLVVERLRVADDVAADLIAQSEAAITDPLMSEAGTDRTLVAAARAVEIMRIMLTGVAVWPR